MEKAPCSYLRGKQRCIWRPFLRAVVAQAEPLQGTGTVVCHSVWEQRASLPQGCRGQDHSEGSVKCQHRAHFQRKSTGWLKILLCGTGCCCPPKGTAALPWVASLCQRHVESCGYPQQPREGTSAESSSHTSSFNRIPGSCKCEMKEAAAEREESRQDCTGPVPIPRESLTVVRGSPWEFTQIPQASMCVCVSVLLLSQWPLGCARELGVLNALRGSSAKIFL